MERAICANPELADLDREVYGSYVRATRENLTPSQARTLRRQQLELYEFQAKEIDDAQLVTGEHDQLNARSKVLGNLEKIKRTASSTYGTLYEEEASILERLKMTTGVLLELCELDETLPVDPALPDKGRRDDRNRKMRFSLRPGALVSGVAG